MSRKLYATLLPVLAVVAFAAVAASSQAAEFHWYKNGTRLPFTSAKTQVISWGTLVLKASDEVTLTCKVTDAGNIWNVSLTTPGKDEVSIFANYECSSEECATASTFSSGFPWATELAAGPVDKIKGIKFVVDCAGMEIPFEGELSPKFVNGTSAEKPSFLEFTPGAGTLTGSGGVTATVTGDDKVLGFENQELITVAAP